MSRDWQEWHRSYDDPTSSISLRLETVRAQLRLLLDAANGLVRLLSLCAGDGRDTLPVVAASDVAVQGVLVELDPVLAERARRNAPPGIEVRTADAGTTASYADAVPVDVLLECGIFGNITDDDIVRTVRSTPSLLRTNGHVIWTRGNNVPLDPSSYDGDPAEMVRSVFAEAGFEEIAFVSHPAGFRVGVHRWPGATGAPDSDVRLFEFV
ncbi:class I SAM-dependent methyltransferase [Nocardioides sp. CN2-186]|uniref:class I SAM-dependent methyltransferase n=1 Tax=Nocardioides tweenelious TaxID=3156607 RepID=UPI0032B3BD51